MTIRAYRPSDQEALRSVCRQTAGAWFRRSRRRLQAVTLLYNDYYTLYEPHNAFVLADDADNAVGYIVCSACPDCFGTRMPHYGRKARRLSWLMQAVYWADMRAVKRLGPYPVHFHMDILPPYQRQGYGTQLLQTLCRHLASQGIGYLSVCHIRPDTVGYKMYCKFGFVSYRKVGFGAVSLRYDFPPEYNVLPTGQGGVCAYGRPD